MTNDNFDPDDPRKAKGVQPSAEDAAARAAEGITPEERAQSVMDQFPANSGWSQASDVVHHAIAQAIREAQAAAYERGKAEGRERAAEHVLICGYHGLAADIRAGGEKGDE
jgi:hypothetical protein